MRLIAYSEKMPLPFIDDISNPEKILKIIGGEWLDGGERLALHCVYNKPGCSKATHDYLAIIPVGHFPSSIEEAMDDRQRELDRGRNLFQEIVVPYRNTGKEE